MQQASWLLILVVVLLAALGIAGPARAVTRTWTGADDNEWFNADNWDPAGLPTPADDLIIDTGTPETDDTVTTDDGGSITVTNGAQANSGGLYVGRDGDGTLTIEAGGQVINTHGYLGDHSVSTGTATVTGTGSTWTNSGDLYVGRSGDGTLTVTDGGLVIAETLWASPSDLFGNGTITARGAVLDADLVFDSTHGLTQALAFGAGGTLNLNVDGSGSLGVGRDGAGTLRIADGRAVASASGCLGDRPGSTGTATVTGVGSTWTNSGDLYVGHDGAGALTVTDGGLVIAETLWASPSDLFGNGTITARGAVLDADLVFDSTHGLTQTLAFGKGGTLNLNVDGSGSLGVGHDGAGTLRIADGRAVASASGCLGDRPGSTGTAIVTGEGSTWTNSGDLYVGRDGDGTLTIEAGGQVSNTYGYLGCWSGSTGAATVTGEGSTWTNSGMLGIGRFGTGILTIEAGGQVSDGGVSLGAWAGSTGTATVTGAGSTWTTIADFIVGLEGDGKLNIEAGGLVSSAYSSLGCQRPGSIGAATVTGEGSTWTISDALDIGLFGTGILTIEAGGLVGSTAVWLGNGSGSTGTATVTGAGSTWTNSYALTVGCLGTGTLTIEAGGLVRNPGAYLGEYSGSTGTATVTGTGSTWTAGTLYVGHDGDGTLTIEAGGLVSSSPRGRAYLGYSSGSTGTAIVTGEGSTWTADNLYVGRDGAGTLTIEAGGLVSNDRGYLGGDRGSTGTATVTGAGSTWTNSDRLYVGDRGDGTLLVEAGGQVSNSSGYLGDSSGSTGTATVTGAGSTWTNSGSLCVGYYGAGTLRVADGGLVTAETLYASVGDLFGDGTITVQGGALLDADLVFDSTHGLTQALAFGAGGTLNLTVDGTGGLGVGYKAAGTLHIADGLSVASSGGYLGYWSGSTGTVTVTGTGSTWTNSGSLYVGRYGDGTLAIEAGGQVSNTDGYLGYGSNSSGTATVTGPGSTWTNSGDLYVGDSGDGTLLVEAGGQVSNGSGYLGYESGSTGTATVTGTGSTWANSGALYVGRDGDGTLTVTDGGLVTAKTLYASLSDLFGDGTITVQGGAVLDTDLVFDSTHGLTQALAFGTGGTLNLTVDGTGGLGVGYKAAGTLHIADGLSVASSGGYLGEGSDSTGTATVTGPGSVWTNSASLYVGRDGDGTLLVEAGGQVSNSSGRLGYGSGSTGTATVTGPGSTWTNSGSLFVGCYGAGTLTVEAGGQVSNASGYLFGSPASTGTVTVTGAGSTWANSGALYVGYDGNSTLTITGGGLVSVFGILAIDHDEDGDAFINMDTGGMLALFGDADDSLAQFLGLIDGTDAIRYWNKDTSAWDDITNGTLGEDYQLTYLTAGDLAGYTRLTVPDLLLVWQGGSGNCGDSHWTDGTNPDLAPETGHPMAVNADTDDSDVTVVGDFDSVYSLQVGKNHESTVTVASGGTLTVDTGVTVGADGTLIVNASGTLNAATVNSSGTLEVNGALNADTLTWAGGTITVGDGVVLDVAGVFGAAADGVTFVKDGEGLLVISGPQDHAPGALFEILAGTVEMNSDASGTGDMADANLSILVADAQLVFDCNQHLDTLTIEDGGLVRLTGANVVVVRHLVMNGMDLGATTLTPEPATLALLAVGALGLLARRRDRTA